MKIVTTNHSLHHRFSIEKTIEMMADAGFDGIDFTDIPVMTRVWEKSYKEYAKYLCKVADDNGISFCQTHAPVTSSMLRQYNGDLQFVVDRICRSIEFASLIGADNVVVHPIQSPKYATEQERVFEENMNFFRQLVPCAEDFGVKLAIENMVMPTLDGKRMRDGVCADPTEFKRYINTLERKNVTGCLDFGHSALAGRMPEDMLRAMGSEYITSLHIHDNDLVHDSHQLPCTMKMNWDEICKAMADIGYNGNFTLEAVSYFNNFDDAFIPEALRFMYKTAEYLVNKIEKYKMG